MQKVKGSKTLYVLGDFHIGDTKSVDAAKKTFEKVMKSGRKIIIKGDC